MGQLSILPAKVKHSVYDILSKNAIISDVIIQTQLDHLDLAPATHQLVGAEVELVGMLAREYILKKSLADMNNKYEYILIDCPPSLGLLTVNALTASHSVLIPIQCEYYAMEGLSKITQAIKKIERQRGGDRIVEGIVVTMYDPHLELAREVAQEVREFFGKLVYTTIIPRDAALSEAPSHGLSIMEYQLRSTGAHAYIELTREVLSNDSTTQTR